jgi:ATP-dependent DNA helicase PIF1
MIVGVFLPEPVFSHGQLYVALSRGVSIENVKILVKDGKVEGKIGCYTKNVAYHVVLE